MQKLLNRFAWAISILLGFFILLIFLGGDLDNDFIFYLIFSLLLGLLIKRFFFSQDFIRERLEFFAESIKNRVLNVGEKINKNIYNEIQNQEIERKQEIEKNEELERNEEIFDEILEKEKINEIEENEDEEYDEDFDYVKEDNYEKNYSKDSSDYVPSKVEESISNIFVYIKDFFSENILAKVGSILVFLGVLFLMSLIWNKIPDIGKILIGFIIGFSIYFSGVLLEKKGYTGESKVLLGAGILINYLVILAGRHVLGNNYGENALFGSGITFFFLILNTVFAIITSFIYKSKTLLIFSFLFAYLNPFLVGGDSSTPYVLCGYSMIISLGALFIGYKNKSELLSYLSFILGNLLFIVAPFEISLESSGSNIGWIVKILCTALLGFLTLISFYKNNQKNISSVFIFNYIFIIIQLFISGALLSTSLSFVTYMILILFFFGVGIWLFLYEAISSVLALILFPIIIVIGLLLSGSLVFITPALGIIVIAYLIGYSFIEKFLPNFFKYIYFIVLGIFIFLVNSYISTQNLSSGFNFGDFLIVIFVSFIFLITSYILSRKKDLEYFYTIGTLGGILTFSPVLFNFKLIEQSNSFLNISVLSVIIFGILNMLLPFINKNLTQESKNIKNLIIGNVFGVLFLGFQLFMYGQKYFPGVTMGFAFAGLAIVYFILGFTMVSKLGFNNIKKDITPKNTILTYLFISISIFSLAVAIVFSNNPEIISAVWIFEASILFYFFSKTKEDKIYVVGLVLFMIGIFNLFGLLDVVKKGDFLFLIPFTIIGISLVSNLKNLDYIKSGVVRVSHDIFHIIGIGILGTLLVEIIPSSGHGRSIFGISIFIFIIGNIYAYFSSRFLKIFFIILFAGFMFYQVDIFNNITWRIEEDGVKYLIILQYLTTIILGNFVLFWNKINKEKYFNNFINGFFVIYLLFIISYYILYIFENTFAVTIFWGIVSSILLLRGISNDQIKFRTIGLYLLAIVLGKIFIYDIWYGLDNALLRVVALIIIGILLIIISTRYTKKYGNNLKGEFSLSNLKDDDFDELDEEENNEKEVEENKVEKELTSKKQKDFVINKKIESVDIGNIKGVEFIFGEKIIKIRAVNLIKIVKLIVENFKGKTKFKAGELTQVYIYAKENFRSDLSQDNYTKIISILDEFIQNGGEVKFVEK